MATFGYGRVSTVKQNTENQRLELENAGYMIDYWFEDTGISGKTYPIKDHNLKRCLKKFVMEKLWLCQNWTGLVDAIDVQQTVKVSTARNIKVIVHQIGNTDLSSPTGKMLLTMLSAVAEMERDLLIERTQSGLQRAKQEGKVFGRPSKTSEKQKIEIRNKLLQGLSVSQISREFGVSRGTIINIRESE